MSPTYAVNTDVSTEKSRLEIERTLERYGCYDFAYARTVTSAKIEFIAGGRHIRFVLQLPDKADYRLTPTRKARTQSSWDQAYEQATRQRWRALALVIKAKLEAVEAGIVTFEDEFAMHMVLPGGEQVRDLVNPAIAEAYSTGVLPQLMGAR